MRTDIGEREIVDKHVLAFNTLIKSLDSGRGIRNYNDLHRFRQSFDDLRNKAESDKWRLSSREGKKAINDLLQATDQMLSQLNKF